MSSEEQVREFWTLGSYPEIGRHFVSMAAELVDAAGVGPGDAVLDVACGTGNVAVTAARRGARVTALDITPRMLDDARENARVAGVDGIDWYEGNATALPFADDTFDATLSCVGHMFADPSAAARELLRVTRPGGRLAFTAWTPTSIVPALGDAIEAHLPPELDAAPAAVLWGDPDVVADRLGDAVTALSFERRTVRVLALSPGHFWEDVTTFSGMFIVALDRVAETDRAALREDVLDAVAAHFDDGANAVEMEYLRTTARVR